MPEDTIVSLHLSPKDEDTNISSLIYYKLGFDRVMYSKSGPQSFQLKIEEFFDKSIDFIDYLEDLSKCQGTGYFLVMMTRLKHFNKNRDFNSKNYYDKSLSLKKTLLNRKKEYQNSTDL